MSEKTTVLQLSSLFAGYGRFDVVRDVDLRVEQGEAVALLGPNGAGKTTVLRAIMGLVKHRRGIIQVGDADVSSLPPYRIARGLAALHLRRDKKRVKDLLASVYNLFPVLLEYRRRRSSFLSGGEQQMVAIGRMLMSDPKILLLDEPSDALAPVAVEAVVKALLELRNRGASLLLVEQRIDVAVRICDRLYIMTHGEIAEEMTPDTVAREGVGIINRYLG
jgi:branched-chain amino acid transport system ATP-binding protein